MREYKRPWSRVLSRSRHVETMVPEAVATLADKFGWEALIFAAMIGASHLMEQAAEKQEDPHSTVQKEDYEAFEKLNDSLQELRESIPALPRVVADWFKERG